MYPKTPLFCRPNPLRLFHLKGKYEKKESFKSEQSNPDRRDRPACRPNRGRTHGCAPTISGLVTRQVELLAVSTLTFFRDRVGRNPCGFDTYIFWNALKMSTKPKILASNPPSIPMPATCLEHIRKRKIDFYNEPKYRIPMPALRLLCIILASLFICLNAIDFRAQKRGVSNTPRKIQE
jgi:hypothetical protein